MKAIISKFNVILNATMNSYLCRKCSTQVQKATTPTSIGCPSGGSHSWTRL